MYLVSIEGTARWEESQLTGTPWRVSMPKHCLLLAGSKVVNVRILQPTPMARIGMPTESLHEIGNKN